MIEVAAPNPIPKECLDKFSVFLGGSIEMGKAENWQKRLVEDLKDHDILILNPRRPDWDSTWVQDPTPGTKFHEQVDWELFMQSMADLRVYYFAADTISPITLLELGTFGTFDNTIVCCNESYPRYGNVKIWCDEFGVTLVSTYEQLVEQIISNENSFSE